MKIVTVGELLQRFASPFRAVTVHEDATLQEVLDVMLQRNEQRSVYVVDGDERLHGVIAVGQLARHLLHEGIAPPSGFSPSTTILHYLTAERAKDIMEQDVVFCTPEETLEDVTQKMLGKHLYKMLPVVDDAMHLIDVISIVTVLEFVLQDGEKRSGDAAEQNA